MSQIYVSKQFDNVAFPGNKAEARELVLASIQLSFYKCEPKIVEMEHETDIVFKVEYINVYGNKFSHEIRFIPYKLLTSHTHL